MTDILGAFAVALVIGASAGWWGHAEITAGRAAREAVEASEQAREVESLRRAAVAKELDRAHAETAAQARAAADLRVTADRLRRHIVALVTEDRTVASGGTAATGPGLVLTQLYAGADGEAVELAIALDASRAAGLICERVYDSLRGAQ